MPSWPYFILSGIYFTIIIWGSGAVNSNFHFKVVCHGSRASKKVAITFDDGPDNKVTPKLLDLLKEYNLSAAFFVIGKKVKENPDLLLRMKDEGHLIGNHTFSHANWFDMYLPRRMVKEMKNTASIIREITGLDTLLFRPPYGVSNPNLTMAMKRTGYIAAGWSLRTLDTIIKDNARIMKKLEKVRAGDVVLFHDTREGNIVLVRNFLEFCIQNGFEVVRFDNLTNVKAYA